LEFKDFSYTLPNYYIAESDDIDYYFEKFKDNQRFGNVWENSISSPTLYKSFSENRMIGDYSKYFGLPGDELTMISESNHGFFLKFSKIGKVLSRNLGYSPFNYSKNIFQNLKLRGLIDKGSHSSRNSESLQNNYENSKLLEYFKFFSSLRQENTLRDMSEFTGITSPDLQNEIEYNFANKSLLLQKYENSEEFPISQYESDIRLGYKYKRFRKFTNAENYRHNFALGKRINIGDCLDNVDEIALGASSEYVDNFETSELILDDEYYAILENLKKLKENNISLNVFETNGDSTLELSQKFAEIIDSNYKKYGHFDQNIGLDGSLSNSLYSDQLSTFWDHF
jgi:hypothetical protein